MRPAYALQFAVTCDVAADLSCRSPLSPILPTDIDPLELMPRPSIRRTMSPRWRRGPARPVPAGACSMSAPVAASSARRLHDPRDRGPRSNPRDHARALERVVPAGKDRGRAAWQERMPSRWGTTPCWPRPCRPTSTTRSLSPRAAGPGHAEPSSGSCQPTPDRAASACRLPAHRMARRGRDSRHPHRDGRPRAIVRPRHAARRPDGPSPASSRTSTGSPPISLIVWLGRARPAPRRARAPHPVAQARPDGAGARLDIARKSAVLFVGIR